MIWNPDPCRLTFCQHDLGYEPGALQNKGIWAGKKSLHGLESVVGDLGILADVFENPNR
jgi:hypothetical protein